MLTENDYQKAADRLGCEVAAIKAVAETESGLYGAFLPDGAPVILFEKHVFHRLTNGKYDHTHPDISSPHAGGYGKVSDQHRRLQEAVALDREAALRSASYGRFQVLGANWESLGYESLQEFINAMYRSEADHLDSFVRFVEVNGLTGALKSHNFRAFARRYNGPNYAANNYDTKMAKAYLKFKAPEI